MDRVRGASSVAGSQARAGVQELVLDGNYPRSHVEQSKPSPAESHGACRLAVDWQAALETNHRWLRTVVYTRLREPDAVEEVMQEVALAAVRQAAPLADPAKVAPWLYRLAVRQALLFRRKCGRRRRLTSQYAERVAVTQRDGAPPSPLDWLLLAERRQVVRDALERLAVRDAEILLLKYSEGWSYHQIAAHLGVQPQRRGDASPSRTESAPRRVVGDAIR